MTGENLSSTTAHWLPFTANRQFHKDPRVVVEARDCHLYQSGQARSLRLAVGALVQRLRA
jgi:adenosylmethionine-8-amino-7-oxononanoate aminotransferase